MSSGPRMRGTIAETLADSTGREPVAAPTARTVLRSAAGADTAAGVEEILTSNGVRLSRWHSEVGQLGKSG